MQAIIAQAVHEVNVLYAASQDLVSSTVLSIPVRVQGPVAEEVVATVFRIEVCRQSHQPGHASQQRETALQLNAGVGNAWSQIIQCFYRSSSSVDAAEVRRKVKTQEEGRQDQRRNETHLMQDVAGGAFESKQVVQLALVQGRRSKASGEREAKRGKTPMREHASRLKIATW